MVKGTVVSVHVGKAAELRGKPGKKSAIDKRAVQGPVPLSKSGFHGDVQVDLRYHGGPFKAVCAYCAVYYSRWEEIFGILMPPGSFGENIHLEGISDELVCIGDLYQLGGAKLRVAGPRGPCSNLSSHWGVKDLHITCLKERATGFYLLVEEPGSVSAGDSMALLERPCPQWTLPAFWDHLDSGTATAAASRELLEMSWLDPDWAPRLRSKLRRAEDQPLS